MKKIIQLFDCKHWLFFNYARTAKIIIKKYLKMRNERKK